MMDVLPYVVAAWIFLAGLYGIVTSRNLIHLVTCLAVVQSSTYLVLLSVGYKKGGEPPVFADRPPSPRAVDPVVQALTLTDVVVGTTVTASPTAMLPGSTIPPDSSLPAWPTPRKLAK